MKGVVDLLLKHKLYPITFQAAKCNLTDKSTAGQRFVELSFCSKQTTLPNLCIFEYRNDSAT